MRGENIYLHGETARETIDKAIEHLIRKTESDSRTKAFKDCTAYWKEEIEDVINWGDPETALAKIAELFGINHNGASAIETNESA